MTQPGKIIVDSRCNQLETTGIETALACTQNIGLQAEAGPQGRLSTQFAKPDSR